MQCFHLLKENSEKTFSLFGDNTPLADPHYLNQPNYSWPLESSSGFSHLWPVVFHIHLTTHKIHNRVGRRKEEQTIMGLG